MARDNELRRKYDSLTAEDRATMAIKVAAAVSGHEYVTAEVALPRVAFDFLGGAAHAWFQVDVDNAVCLQIRNPCLDVAKAHAKLSSLAERARAAFRAEVERLTQAAKPKPPAEVEVNGVRYVLPREDYALVYAKSYQRCGDVYRVTLEFTRDKAPTPEDLFEVRTARG
jgi:hypothetical protein